MFILVLKKTHKTKRGKLCLAAIVHSCLYKTLAPVPERWLAQEVEPPSLQFVFGPWGSLGGKRE